MSTRFATTLLLATVLGLAGTHAASAKKPVDKFDDFKGKFNGTAIFVVSSGSPALTGTGTIIVSGPKNGKSLKLVFSGTVFSGGGAAPYSNTITIAKNGSYVIAQGVFALSGVTASSSVGTASVAKKLITGAGTFALAGTPANVNFSIRSKTVKKKRTLTIDYVVSSSGSSYPFQFVVTGRVKK